MSSSIPTSASVVESTVIDAPISHVWHLVKLEDFSKFWTKLSKSEFVKGVSPDTDIVKWTFKDGTVLEVKQEEHSVCPRSELLIGVGCDRCTCSWANNSFTCRPSTTSSPTQSSRRARRLATLPSSAQSACSRSLLVIMRGIHSSSGLQTSLVMPMLVCCSPSSLAHMQRHPDEIRKNAETEVQVSLRMRGSSAVK